MLNNFSDDDWSICLASCLQLRTYESLCVDSTNGHQAAISENSEICKKSFPNIQVKFYKILANFLE